MQPSLRGRAAAKPGRDLKSSSPFSPRKTGLLYTKPPGGPRCQEPLCPTLLFPVSTAGHAIIQLHMSTLSVLFESLAAARRAGHDFDFAWEAAIVAALGQACNPGDWEPVLDGTRGTWERAYVGLPATSSERALSLLGEDGVLTDVRNVCRRCSQPIPPERQRRAPALYCCDHCRRAWHAERAALAA